MAYYITPSLTILAITFIAFSSVSIAVEKRVTLSSSTISAAPSIPPDYTTNAAAPALSPDISPLFPSPGASNLSPAESSVPLIPSSPSPPNPDAMEASGPGAAFAPSDGLPESSSHGLNVAVFFSSMVVAVAAIWVNQDSVFTF